MARVRSSAGAGGVGLCGRLGDAHVVQQAQAVALVVLEDGGKAVEAGGVVCLAQVDAADLHRATLGLVQAGDQTHQCALAGAVLAHDGDRFAGGDGEA